MKMTLKMTQPLPAALVISTTQARDEPMEVPAPEAPHVALPSPEGPQMQDVAVEEEQASLAQDESSGSSASEQWVEPEDPHPLEKRVRRSSPDPAEDLPKTYECRRKKIRRVMEETPVSAAAQI